MNILITGATRGIGYHMALEFIKRGHRVFGIGRGWENPADTEKKFDGRFVPIRCDISKESERLKLFSYLSEKNIEIDVLVNNAGIGSLGKFQNIKWEESQDVINLNITALTHMCFLFLNSLKKPDIKNKGIINVSSTGAFQTGGVYIAVYYAGKAFVKSFTEGLCEELRDEGIRVMCLCPGPVKTDFKGMKNTKKSFYIMSPEETANIAVRDYFRGKEICIPGKINKFFVFISKFIPRKIELKINKNIQKNKKL